MNLIFFGPLESINTLLKSQSLWEDVLGNTQGDRELSLKIVHSSYKCKYIFLSQMIQVEICI